MKQKIRSISLTFFVFVLGIMPTLAQDEALGREATRDDWISYMPILIGSIVIVIVVDAFFIVPIFRKGNSKKNEEGN